ncbi:hypothetical protein ACR6C2_30330 [Streptomyces sp. INA 01156]
MLAGVPWVREARVRTPSSFAAWSVAAGTVWLLGALAALTAILLTSPSWPAVVERTASLTAPLAGGWMAQVLMGALSFLVPVVLGAAHRRAGHHRGTGARRPGPADPRQPVAAAVCAAGAERGARDQFDGAAGGAGGLPDAAGHSRTDEGDGPDGGPVGAPAGGPARGAAAAPVPGAGRCGRRCGGGGAGRRRRRCGGRTLPARDRLVRRCRGRHRGRRGGAAHRPDHHGDGHRSRHALHTGHRRGARGRPAGDRGAQPRTDQHDLVLETGARTARLAPGKQGTLDAGVVGRDLDGWCSVVGHRQMGMVLAVEATGSPAGRGGRGGARGARGPRGA